MMKKILTIAISLLVSLIFIGKAQALGPSEYIYYYGQGCPHCANVQKYFDKNNIQKSFSIEKKEVYSNPTNAEELNNLFESMEIPFSKRGVPAILTPDGEVLVGDKPIIDHFESLETGNAQEDDKEPTKNSSNLTILAVISGALVDSINPCAFAVLIILITTILATGNKKKALAAGFAFATSIFISYVAMGLGLYKALTVGNLPLYFMKFIGVLAIILGLLNLKDYFNYGGFGFVMEVPMKWRPKMKELLSNVASPTGAFFIGFLISLFLLPCTSGPYIVVLGMLSHRELFGQAVAYLILYNIIFVLPMIIITLAVYKGYDIKKAEEIRKKQIKKLHLIAGIILILMGLAIVFGLI